MNATKATVGSRIYIGRRIATIERRKTGTDVFGHSELILTVRFKGGTVTTARFRDEAHAARNLA